MSEKPQLIRRDDFAYLEQLATRWNDNDSYGHINNVKYYEYFDSVVNRWLINQGVLDIEKSEIVGFVVETKCQYFSSIVFPDQVTVGVRVVHLGNSSVRYEIGIFKNEEEPLCALGHFVHVYVDRASQKSVPIPEEIRTVLATLLR